MGTIKKRMRQVDLSDVTEPDLSDLDWEDFKRGIVLFNDGEFWESHEAWEEVWQRHPENSRIFFQGLIQVAAGFHQLQRQIFHGADKHFRNALWKLKPFRPRFLGLDVEAIVKQVERSLREVHRLGPDGLHRFDTRLIPKLKIVNP